MSNNQDRENMENFNRQVDLEMKELTHCVLQGSGAISKATRQTFLDVVKSFYYVAYCSTETVDSHIAKVIFEDVI
jgi:hypothetical protein